MATCPDAAAGAPLHHSTTETEVEEILAALPQVVAQVPAELGATGR